MIKTMYVRLPMEIPKDYTGCVLFIRLPGLKYYLQNGQFHRLDGPALERSNGDSEYYIQGIFLPTQEDFVVKQREFLLKANITRCQTVC